MDDDKCRRVLCTDHVLVKMPHGAWQNSTVLPDEAIVPLPFSSKAVLAAMRTSDAIARRQHKDARLIVDDDDLVQAAHVADFCGWVSLLEVSCVEMASRGDTRSHQEHSDLCALLPRTLVKIYAEKTCRDTCAQLSRVCPGTISGPISAFQPGGFRTCHGCIEWIKQAVIASIIASQERVIGTLAKGTVSPLAHTEHHDEMSDESLNDSIAVDVDDPPGGRAAWTIDYGDQLLTHGVDMDVDGWVAKCIATIACGALFSRNWHDIDKEMNRRTATDAEQACMLCAARFVHRDCVIETEYIDKIVDHLCVEYSVEGARKDLEEEPGVCTLPDLWHIDATSHSVIFSMAGFCEHCGQVSDIDGLDGAEHGDCGGGMQCQWSYGDARRFGVAKRMKIKRENDSILSKCGRRIPVFRTPKKMDIWRCKNCNKDFHGSKCGHCFECCRSTTCARHFPRRAKNYKFVRHTVFVNLGTEDRWAS
jgi:hypothetical protein